MYNNSLHGKVWKQDADPGASANDNDIWVQTTGGGVTPTATKLRFAGAWVTSPTVAVNSDAITQGSTNLYLSTGTLNTVGAALGQSLANPGYCHLPGGIIMQWGSVSVTIDSSASVTYPIAFPTAVVYANAAGTISVVSGGSLQTAMVIIPSGLSGATIYNDTTTQTCRWLAIGY